MNGLLKFWSFVFGLLPMNRSGPSSTTAGINLIDYALMVIVPCCYLICYGMVNGGRTYGIYQDANCDSICRIGNMLFMHIGCFLYLSVAGLSIWRGKGFYRLFDERLQDVDLLIGQIYKQVNTKVEQNIHHVLYFLTWLFAVVGFVFDIGFDSFMLFGYYDIFMYIPLMITTFPYVAGSIVQAQFIYYVTIIKTRFSKLNAIFDRINSECDVKNGPIEVFDIESDLKKNETKPPEPATLKRKEKKLKKKAKKEKQRLKKANKKGHKKKHKAAESSSSDSDTRTTSESSSDGGSYSEASTAEKGTSGTVLETATELMLPELFRLHDKILELSVLTNSEYGAQAVPYMAACFVINIFGIFLQTKVSFIVGGRSAVLDYVSQLFLIWSITTAFVAYLVLRMCCSAATNAKKSVIIIHEIMQKKPAFMLGNDLYYNKMKSFTLQFLHWDGYFQFNGIGLFALDYTFIFSTVSAATSYLIVLLQFDMSTILRNEGLLD